MLYLEAWDVFAPASYKGAAPICYYCRQSGHIRNACPELMKRVCFGCGNKGHTRRFCRVKEPEEKTDTELLREYDDARQSQTPGTSEDNPAEQLFSNDLSPTATSGSVDLTADHEEVYDEIQSKNVSDIEMEDESMLGSTEPSTRKLKKTVDPSESIHASKHAPYHTATTMKIDSQAEMLDISSVKQTTKVKNDKVKRSLLLKSKSSTPRKTTNLVLNPVIPPHKSKDLAHRAQ
ncbi:hypothetical protein K492DRAFT_182083 [Lichtheimia hyalospora FSU 10163]|nr:hypothetical protein K492DRAFT_182083 [Lichtheimia hyalospora FSU 10163]